MILGGNMMNLMKICAAILLLNACQALCADLKEEEQQPPKKAQPRAPRMGPAQPAMADDDDLDGELAGMDPLSLGAPLVAPVSLRLAAQTPPAARSPGTPGQAE